jgi:hypothetical protein
MYHAALDIRDHQPSGPFTRTKFSLTARWLLSKTTATRAASRSDQRRSARQHDRIEKPLIPGHKLTRCTYRSGPGATRTMAEIARPVTALSPGPSQRVYAVRGLVSPKYISSQMAQWSKRPTCFSFPKFPNVTLLMSGIGAVKAD